jgi:two-component system sensor histidine kinase KdpD
MVGLSSRGPNSARLLRYASRLAGRLNRNWYAVYVQVPSEDPISIDATTQRLLSETLTLANQLGATVFTFKGDDVAQTLLRVAKEYRVGHIVIGKPHAPPGWRRVLGKDSVAEQLLYADSDLTIVVINVQSGQGTRSSQIMASAAAPEVPRRPVLTGLLKPSLIVDWTAPVSRATVMRTLVETIASQAPEVQRDDALRRLEHREQQGSTFLPGGVALPHARVEGLSTPHIAFGITHAGISDMPNCDEINAIFLILSPPSDHKSHFQLLAAASRLVRIQEFRNGLDQITHAEAAYALIARCERTST